MPVLKDLDSIRNCPHCRQFPGDRTCRAWQEARKSVRTLRQEARRFAKEVTELNAATGGCADTLYQFLDASVGYFAPDAPMWREAGDLTGQDLDKALEVLQRRGQPGGKARWPLNSTAEDGALERSGKPQNRTNRRAADLPAGPHKARPSPALIVQRFHKGRPPGSNLRPQKTGQ